MVIVTKNQYLLASKIHHVTLDEHVEFVDARAGGKLISVRNTHYTIHVIYSPDSINTNSGNNNSSRDEYKECNVTIRSKVDAHKVFNDLITQIREQMPDTLFLDKALERMLAGTDLDAAEIVDQRDRAKQALKDIFGGNNDRSTKKVRKPRKTKRKR